MVHLAAGVGDMWGGTTGPGRSDPRLDGEVLGLTEQHPSLKDPVLGGQGLTAPAGPEGG